MKQDTTEVFIILFYFKQMYSRKVKFVVYVILMAIGVNIVVK